MHKGILSQWLNNHAVIGHTVRAAALIRVVRALLTGNGLESRRRYDHIRLLPKFNDP